MSETLTYFQGLILRIFGEMGESSIDQISKPLLESLQKDCQYQRETIVTNVKLLVKKDYLTATRRVFFEGSVENGFNFYTLTKKGEDYVKPALSKR